MKIYNRRLPTIKQLQYFLAVCEENSFRKAAIKLGVSQPPLSIQIRELEEKLSTSLILRNKQQILLTKEGEAFRSEAAKLLNELCMVTHSLQAKPSDKIILGMTKTLGFNFIPIFRDFMSKFTDDLVLYNNNYAAKELLIELQKNNIDFAVTSHLQQEDKNIHRYLVHQESMLLALPESHKAAKNHFIDLNDVLDMPLYWFNRYQHPTYYEQCEKIFKNLSYPLTRRTELVDTLTMLFNVSLSKAMLLLPQSMAKAKVPGVVYKKLTPYLEKRLLIDVYLVWHDNVLSKKSAEHIISYFKQHASDVYSN